MNAAIHQPTIAPDAVLTKATLRAAALLGLPNATLGKIIGVSPSTVSRYSDEGRINPHSKPGELALMLVRVFRSLDPLVGSDDVKRQTWMHSRNRALNGIPAELIQTADGLSRTLAYLDGMRAPA